MKMIHVEISTAHIFQQFFHDEKKKSTTEKNRFHRSVSVRNVFEPIFDLISTNLHSIEYVHNIKDSLLS